MQIQDKERCPPKEHRWKRSMKKMDLYRKERRDGMERRKVYRELLIGFFVLMAGLTLASRIYDTMTVPKVHVVCPRLKAVRMVTEGSGQVKATETVFCQVEPQIRIQSVTAVRGSQVEPGDELFCYDAESLRMEREARQQALEKARLALAREQLLLQGEAAKEQAKLTQGELAAQEVAFAAQALEKGQKEYEAAYLACEEKKRELEEAYMYKEELTREELLRTVEQELAAGQMTLDGTENSREEAIREGERVVEDAEEEVERLEAEGADEEAVEKALRRLARAREDARAIREQWDLQLDTAIAGLDVSEESEDKILAGRTTAQLALKESYEAALEQEDARLEEKRKEVEDLALELEKARLSWSNGTRTDQAARLDAEQKERLSQLAQEELVMDLDEALAQLQKIEELIRCGGIVRAAAKGTVIVQELTPGKKTSGEELVEIGVGRLTFCGTFTIEGENAGQTHILYPGDKVTIDLPGRSGQTECQIRLVDMIGEEGKGSFLADLEDGTLPVGTVADYGCTRESAVCSQVIPIKALRNDSGGYFCLVAREKEGILGREIIAERVELTPTCWGKEEVAVEGILFQEDQIILKEKEKVKEGDRVRVILTASPEAA